MHMAFLKRELEKELETKGQKLDIFIIKLA